LFVSAENRGKIGGEQEQHYTAGNDTIHILQEKLLMEQITPDRKSKQQRQELTDAQRTALISWIAEGLGGREIRNNARNFRAPFNVSESKLAYYRSALKIDIARIRAERDDLAINAGLALRSNRLQSLYDLARMLEDDIKQNNKLWLLRVKGVGSGSSYERVVEEEFNESELRQLRGLYEDIAREVGARGSGDEKNSDEELTGAFYSNFSIPADAMAPSFFNVFRDIKERKHMEYVLKGGRGSTKSSFTSLVIIYLLITHPTLHVVALRQVANTLRDSVYSQLVWAIGMLGLSEQFKCITSPLEITYKPTGQKIYFRGADKPEMIKSIKPIFGYTGVLWFEELDQFHGPEAVRKIEQSVLRGGDEIWEFKTYNPPKSEVSWVNKYVQIPKKNQLQHHSTYHDVPVDWLGQTFIDEAEHLKEVNPAAHDHEYEGLVTGTGGMIFDNIMLREITDAEIAQFDNVGQGLDWGYFPDPLAWGKSHYDAARLTLYIFDEYRGIRKSNRVVYDDLVRLKNLLPHELIIADSAEPKSIADFREYGANMRGAEKGADSVMYSIKWMQSLKAIVIDPQRCPYHAEEFLNYELPQDKDGNCINEYPDENNHFIDAQRYRTNLIWRRRGQ
jgi:PBSX family phage terminase large subunit